MDDYTLTHSNDWGNILFCAMFVFAKDYISVQRENGRLNPCKIQKIFTQFYIRNKNEWDT